MVGIVMVARDETIADLIDRCARGELPFDECCAAIAQKGYRTTSVYEMVCCREKDIEQAKRAGY